MEVWRVPPGQTSTSDVARSAAEIESIRGRARTHLMVEGRGAVVEVRGCVRDKGVGRGCEGRV